MTQKSTVAFIRDEEDEVVEKPSDTNPFSKPEECKKVGDMTADELAYIISQTLRYYHGKEAKGAPKEKNPTEHDNALSSVLGTAGNVLHGVVDIAEGTLRGAVDLLTFGKAKR